MPPLDPTLEAGIRTANITRFFPAREYYTEYRDGHESISAYVRKARRTLTMVGINLAVGHELEKIEEVFAELVERDPPVCIRVSLLDYEDDSLMTAIGSIVDKPADEIKQRISSTFASLCEFHEALDGELRDCVELYRHRTIPAASAILIDANSEDGLIQVETKPYRAAAVKSWALEVAAGSEFFETLREAYHALVGDGIEVLPGCKTGEIS